MSAVPGRNRSPAESEQAAPEDAAATPARELKRSLAELLHAAHSGVRDTLELAAAELGLAAMSGLSMIVMMAMVAAALIVAWGLVTAMIGYLLVLAGLPVLVAGLVLTAAQLALAYFLWRATLKLSRNLTLPELRGAVLGAKRAGGDPASASGSTATTAASTSD